MIKPVQVFGLGRQIWQDASAAERFTMVAGGLVALAATIYLLPFWAEQPELSHGYFALPCWVALLRQSRREVNFLGSWHPGIALLTRWLIPMAGIGVAIVSALAALVHGPYHSQTAFAVGIAISLFLCSSLLVLAQPGRGWVRFNAASLASIALWWCVIPLPAGPLFQLTIQLQDLITAGSLRALHLLGYAAVRHGNVIQLSQSLVGVEEACSGIRSLMACIFAGVVLGGLMLPGIVRRLLLILGAAAMALLANFARSTFLCILSARGIEINGFWHDATAFAVLGATALTLFSACIMLGRENQAAPETGPETQNPDSGSLSTPHLTFALIGVALLLLVFVRPSAPAQADPPPPNLAQILAVDDRTWLRRSDTSLFAFSKALNTTFLHQETYFRGDIQLTFYAAFWPAGRSTVGAVAIHTPEICLPGNGWRKRDLAPEAEAYPFGKPQRFAFENEADSYPQHIWFWHFFNGRPVDPSQDLFDWRSVPALLRRPLVASAPQWVIRVSSNKPVESLANEPILAEIVTRLKNAGLAAAPVRS